METFKYLEKEEMLKGGRQWKWVYVIKEEQQSK
jgi:hypothetical protein